MLHHPYFTMLWRVKYPCYKPKNNLPRNLPDFSFFLLTWEFIMAEIETELEHQSALLLSKLEVP